MMKNYIFAAIGEGMAQTNVSALLDPKGPKLQASAQGAPNAGRVTVAVHWPEIEKALDSGFTISAIYRVLSKEDVVSVSLRSFTRQVKARREGAKASRATTKAADEAPASPAAGAAGAAEQSHGPTASATAGLDRPAAAERPPAGPQRAWRTGPREAPDPKAVFKPRDPLADD
jgi:hypothetical protein